MAAGLGCAVAALARAPLAGALAATLVLGGAAVGDLRLAAIDAPATRLRGAESMTVRAWLVTPVRPGRFGSSAEVTVSRGPLRGARLLVRASRWAPLPERSAVGDGLTIRGTLTRLHPHASSRRSPSSSFDYGAQLRRRGVAGELYVQTVRPDRGRRGGIPGALDSARRRAETGVDAGLDPAGAELLRGMVLGEDEHIDPGVRQDFRDSGLAHLLAVSGQNVVLLAALALPLLALAGLGVRARLLGLLLLTALYVPLAGAGPALQRAGVMGAAGIAATAASRPASGAYALLLAAAVTLAANPRAAGDPGWQLSFAAVAGIIVLAPPLRRGFASALDALRPSSAPEPGRIRVAASRAAVDGVAMSVAATITTAPLLALHFGRVPLAGLPANLLALPAVAPVWAGDHQGRRRSACEPGPARGAACGRGGVRARMGGRGAARLPLLGGAGVRRSARRSGRSPRAIAADPGHGVWPPAGRLGRGLAPPPWRGPCPGGGGRLAAPAPNEARGRRGGGRRRTPARHRTPAAPPRPPRVLTVRFLDVGQGDATLIQVPSGAAILFDAGPPEASAWRLLRRAGVRRLAAVVATHPSRDHHGGLVDVLHRFPVDVVLRRRRRHPRPGLPGGGIGGRSPGDPGRWWPGRAPPSPWAPSACGCSPAAAASRAAPRATRIHGA